MDPVTAKTIQSVLSQIGSSSSKVQAGAGSADFGGALKSAIDKVSTQQTNADQLAQRFTLSDPTVSLEETMISMQTASVSFQAMVQVRNKLVSAYQDIMNMQV